MAEDVSERVIALLKSCGAMREGHFIYTSRRHGEIYVDKDAVYPHTTETSWLALWLALRFRDDKIEAVVGPALGGIVLAHLTAAHLKGWAGGHDVLGLYAEKTRRGFKLTRGFDVLLKGKRTLLVEDVLTTGGSVRKLADAVRSCGAQIVGVAALCNRGGLTAERLGVPRLEALLDLPTPSWPKRQCPLCKTAVPFTEKKKG